MTSERPPPGLIARLRDSSPADRREDSSEESSPEGGAESSGGTPCAPDLGERFATWVRACRGATIEWVAGCPVAVHPSGHPFAAAYGAGGLLVACDEPAGALAPAGGDPGPGPPWIALDPDAADVTFTRARDLLRIRIQRAYTRAGE